MIRLGISKLAATAVLALILFSTETVAQEWTVLRTTGEVWIGADRARSVSLSNGDVLEAGASISTGRNGRVMLARGEQRILLSPDSAIELPVGQSGPTVVQSLGRALFDVDRRDIPHFSVETPYLAAVVKGTRFAVTVHDGGAEVSVDRGRVEVTDRASGQAVDLLPDQTATVLRSNSSGIVVSGASDDSPAAQGGEPAPLPRGLHEAEANQQPQRLMDQFANNEATRFSPPPAPNGYPVRHTSGLFSDLDEEAWLIIAFVGLFAVPVGGRALWNNYRARGRRKPRR